VVGNDEHALAMLTLQVTGPGGEHTGPSIFVFHVRDGSLTEFWAMNEEQAAIDKVVDG
jgi:hypothetical protein